MKQTQVKVGTKLLCIKPYQNIKKGEITIIDHEGFVQHYNSSSITRECFEIITI